MTKYSESIMGLVPNNFALSISHFSSLSSNKLFQDQQLPQCYVFPRANSCVKYTEEAYPYQYNLGENLNYRNPGLQTTIKLQCISPQRIIGISIIRLLKGPSDILLVHVFIVREKYLLGFPVTFTRPSIILYLSFL